MALFKVDAIISLEGRCNASERNVPTLGHWNDDKAYRLWWQGCIFVYERKVEAVLEEECMVNLKTANIPFWQRGLLLRNVEKTNSYQARPII